MDLLNDKISKIYLKFLASAFGSALITSIYGLVDTAMVGQYHGPDGSAAMGIIAPFWNIIYSFGLLAGIGGSVLFAVEKGKSNRDSKYANTYFTASVIFGILISAVLTAIIFFKGDAMLRIFGADDNLIVLCRQYLLSVKFTVPFYVFSQIFAAFLRNDSNPALATKSVLVGGIFNVFGDWFFVFKLDMGIKGAGIATAIGAVISVLLMATHFVSKKNTLKFVFPSKCFKLFGKISVNGFSTFLIDIAMGVLTMLFNRQIMKYLGTDALAVYAIIVNISTFVQCCGYGIGQAAQPIISVNFGAKKIKRINEVLKYSIISAFALGIIWTAAVFAAPNGFINLFMSPTENVLKIAPAIIRTYGISFILLPLNVFATYYFQATLKPAVSVTISLARGIILSGILIIILPVIFTPSSIWLSMPITEAITSIFAVVSILIRQKSLTSSK